MAVKDSHLVQASCQLYGLSGNAANSSFKKSLLAAAKHPIIPDIESNTKTRYFIANASKTPFAARAAAIGRFARSYFPLIQ